MEKSIEDIWKEGFISNNALVAPKVNDLYTRKSKSLIERMMRMMKVNNIMLVVGGGVLSLVAHFLGQPVVWSITLFALFLIIALYGTYHLRKVQHIDHCVNSYEYLKSFDNWLKNHLRKNGAMSSIFYPVFVLEASSIVWYSKGRDKVLEGLLTKYPDLPMVEGMPLYFMLIVAGLCLVTAIFGKAIYKWDVGVVYGRVFRKLEELISDLEELRETA